MVEKDGPSSNVGWRFAAGIVLIVGGYIAWTFIPVVVATDLSTGAKSVLTALLGATPFMTKIAAVAVMGKPGTIGQVYVRNSPGARVSDSLTALGTKSGAMFTIIP